MRNRQHSPQFRPIQYKEAYIYLIIHPKFDGWVKIGRTVNLVNRLLTYQVGCPNREYKYVYTKLVSIDLLRKIEDYFKVNIHSRGWEWYKISIEEAISIIEKIINTINL